MDAWWLGRPRCSTNSCAGPANLTMVHDPMNFTYKPIDLTLVKVVWCHAIEPGGTTATKNVPGRIRKLTSREQ